MVSLLALAVLQTKSASWDVVVSAMRFGEKLGIVYNQGAPQLFRFHLDGSGAKQLTSGGLAHTTPTIGAGPADIRFIESPMEDPYNFGSPVIACNFDATGRIVHGKTLPKGRSWWDEGDTAEAVKSKYLKYSDAYYATIVPAKGDPFDFEGRVRVSPDGRYALVSAFEKGSGIVNLKTGDVARIPPDILITAWVDSNTIFGFRDASPKSAKPVPSTTVDVILFNANGAVKHRVRTQVKQAENEDSILDDTERVERVWPTTDPDIVLIEQHHSMSDGGYNFTHQVNLKTGQIKPAIDGTIYAESADHTKLLSGVSGWVGGYKAPGARKLDRLKVWDTRTLKETDIGFRRMLCFGACFVPRGN